MFKLKKKQFFTAIVVLWILSAIPVFYATSLVLEGVLQKDCPILLFFLRLTPGLSTLFLSFDLILFIFYLLRLYIHPTHEKRMLKVYGITLASFSFLGLIFTTISCWALYGSIFIPRPWSGFHFVMYALHLIMMAVGFLMIFYFPKKVKYDDIISNKTNVKYVFQTMLLAFIFFVSLNRLGALFLMPVYVQVRTLALTYPAYVALFLPSLILFNDLVYVFRFWKRYPRIGVVISAFVLEFSLFFFAQIMYRGTHDQLFVQLCSPFNPLGRLAIFPVDAILEVVISFSLAAFTLVHSIYFKRMTDIDELPYEVRVKVRRRYKIIKKR